MPPPSPHCLCSAFSCCCLSLPFRRSCSSICRSSHFQRPLRLPFLPLPCHQLPFNCYSHLIRPSFSLSQLLNLGLPLPRLARLLQPSRLLLIFQFKQAGRPRTLHLRRARKVIPPLPPSSNHLPRVSPHPHPPAIIGSNTPRAAERRYE